MSAPNFHAVSSIIIRDASGAVLLSRRANTGYLDGWWAVPAGHVEAYERPVEALVREAREELGIAVSPEAARLVHVHTNVRRGDRSQTVFYFEVSDSGEIPRNAEPEKCSEIRFFAPKQFPEAMVPHMRVALEAVFLGEPFSETTSE